MMITSSTSIIGIRLISGLAERPRPKFMVGASATVAVDHFHEADGLLVHLDDEAIHGGPEMAPEDHAGYRDHQAEAGVVEGDGDAVGELLGLEPPGAWSRRSRSCPPRCRTGPSAG
jgi:hypothetical protein